MDDNGTISTDELRELLDRLNININDRDIETLMQQADVDGNGLADYIMSG